MDQFTLSVARPRAELALPGAPADAPVAWEEHRRRADALHDLFPDKDPNWSVDSWGDTDDTEQPHEIVEVLIDLLVEHQEYVKGGGAFVALKVGEKLLMDGLDAVAINPLKRLLRRLVRKTAEEDAISSATLYFPRSKLRIEVVAGEDGTVNLFTSEVSTGQTRQVAVNVKDVTDGGGDQIIPAPSPSPK